MKLSVIIPFYRELHEIGHAVHSVLKNCDAINEIEILICNDGTITEGEIRAQLGANESRFVRVLPNRFSKGPGGARNTGLEACSGSFVAFLDADDRWLAGKLEAQLGCVREGANFVSTGYRFDSGVYVAAPRSIDRPADIFLKRGIGTSTILASRELIGSLRFLDLRFAQDIDFWYRLAMQPAFRYAAVASAQVEYSTGGSTKNKWVQLKFLCKVLRLNRVNYFMQARIIASYVLTGVYKHYFGRFFS